MEPIPGHSKGFAVLVYLDWWLTRVATPVLLRWTKQAHWYIDSELMLSGALPVDWRRDGLLASHTLLPGLRRLLRRQAACQPTVVIGHNELNLPAPSVREDNAAAGRLVARHFLENRHRHFAWYTAYYGDAAKARREGFVSELQRAGHGCTLLEYHDPPAGTVVWRHRRQWIARQLRRLPRPLALFALDDHRAAEVSAVCQEQGWRVPEDIAVAGVGNYEFVCEAASVPLTSVDLGEADVIQRACELLDEMMRGAKHALTEEVLPLRGLVVRASSDALAIVDPRLQKAVRFLRANLAQPIGVPHIAEAGGLSVTQLYQLCQENLQRTPAALLREYRFAQARRLLQETKQSVRSIGAACGFGTARTFFRSFAQTHQMGPTAWRKKHRPAPQAK